MTTRRGAISLRPVTEDNRSDVERLAVAESQVPFVGTVAGAFLEAAEDPDGRAMQFGLYDGETPVGFVMLSEEVGNPSYVAHYLWKLLIDKRFQRRGYGTAAIDLVAEDFRSRGVEAMWTSATEGEGGPLPFYERYGFVRQGRTSWGEVMLRLDL
jgi:diamine N-acetyltransferase